MQSEGPSRTAVASAVHRAAHLLLDAEPKILIDPFARAFAGYDSDAGLLHDIRSRALHEFPRMRTALTLRHRYAEDELAVAMAGGVGQLIILGAGLDSFAYRRPDLAGTLEVFEVDQLVSQAWKLGRVAELGLARPPHLHHVPIDLAHHKLKEHLAAGGVDFSRPVFLTWLGGIQYLTSEAVQQVLAELGDILALNSGIAIQYVVPPDTLAPGETALVEKLAAKAASFGEPWHSYFSPAEIGRMLKRAGFNGISHAGPREATERYLNGRSDGLNLPAYFHMVQAWIR